MGNKITSKTWLFLIPFQTFHKNSSTESKETKDKNITSSDRDADLYIKYKWLLNSCLWWLDSQLLTSVSGNKCSAVSEMGDRFATIDMGRKEGAAVPISGG